MQRIMQSLCSVKILLMEPLWITGHIYCYPKYFHYDKVTKKTFNEHLIQVDFRIITGFTNSSIFFNWGFNE